MRWAGEGAGAPRITRRGIHRPMLIPCTWVVVPAGLMGRGRSRGVGDPRITRHGIHRPKLVTPSRDGVALPDEGGRGECDGPARAPALPGSCAKEVTVQNLSPQAGIALPVQTSAVVVNAMGRRGRRRSQDHAPRHSPPDPHSPHMGRGSCRTDGDVVDLVGVGAPRITPRLPLHFVCCDVVPVDVLPQAGA